MNELRYTLLSDGSSDQALMPILDWVLEQNGVAMPVQSEWADLRRLLTGSKQLDLSRRIELSLELYPCDLLFVHRDAEKEPRQVRVMEVRNALENCPTRFEPVVCVVPVRMQEAWLLFDEPALRFAAGNPNGRQPLELPQLSELERLPDPKSRLHELLRQASGLTGRRLKKFGVNRAARRIAEVIDDFTPLRALPAFRAFEADLEAVVESHGWNLE